MIKTCAPVASGQDADWETVRRYLCMDIFSAATKVAGDDAEKTLEALDRLRNAATNQSPRSAPPLGASGNPCRCRTL